MAIIKQTVSDEEWTRRAKPLFEETNNLIMKFDEAVSGASISHQWIAEKEVFYELPVISRRLDNLPKPTSPAAREAYRNLQLAVRGCYLGVKERDKLLNRLSGRLGRRMRRGGLATKLAMERFEYKREIIEEFLISAKSDIKEASHYFSVQ
jgi:hypothetical protein